MYSGYERELFSTAYGALVNWLMNKDMTYGEGCNKFWETVVSQARDIPQKFNKADYAVKTAVTCLSWLEYSCNNNNIQLSFDGNNIYNGVERYIFGDVYSLVVKFKSYIGEKGEYYWDTWKADKSCILAKYNNIKLCVDMMNDLERMLRMEAGLSV